jgi:hypothetical protein
MKTPWTLRIQELKALGLDYADIAARTGMAFSTVGSLATGQTKAPNGDGCLRLYLLHLSLTTQRGFASAVPPVVLLEPVRRDGRQAPIQRNHRGRSVEGAPRPAATDEPRASVA